jgi:putative intracellular protease/amidase
MTFSSSPAAGRPRNFACAKKPWTWPGRSPRTLVAAIGHGPQLLLSAGALDGKSVTCDAGIRDDIRCAAAVYRDEAVVMDGALITARGNDDLPAFCEQIVLALAASAQ